MKQRPRCFAPPPAAAGDAANGPSSSAAAASTANGSTTGSAAGPSGRGFDIPLPAELDRLVAAQLGRPELRRNADPELNRTSNVFFENVRDFLKKQVDGYRAARKRLGLPMDARGEGGCAPLLAWIFASLNLCRFALLLRCLQVPSACSG